MNVGDIVRYKGRYIGQLFIVVDTKTSDCGQRRAKCRRVHDNHLTRWSKIETMEMVND